MTPSVADYAPNIGSGVLMIAVAAAFVAAARLRLGRVWPAIAIGGGLWLLAVVLKVGWALLANSPIYLALTENLGGAGIWLFYAYVGSLTGVFECLVVYLIVARVRFLRTLDANGALALGAGFGGLEAALLGLSALATTLVVVLYPEIVPAEALAQLGPIDWLLAPVGAVERVSAILAHVFTCAAIVFAARGGGLGWLWIAFVYKSALDAVAVWAQLGFGLDSAAKIWTVEAIVAAFGAVAVIGIVRLVRDWPSATPPPD